jgi:glutamine synthetase
MPGSSMSISSANTMLNTAVAEELCQFADELESAKDFEAALHELICRVIREHKRIIFNGNGYDESWIAEAESRGLLNLKSTPDTISCMKAEKNIALFEKHHVYSRTEMESRADVKAEKYCKVITIEAMTMVDMVRKDILPAVSTYLHELADTALAKKSFLPDADVSYEENLCKTLSSLCGAALTRVSALEEALMGAKEVEGSQELAFYCRDHIFAAMNELRIAVDEMETMTSAKVWPYPSYGELLFSVQ